MINLGDSPTPPAVVPPIGQSGGPSGQAKDAVVVPYKARLKPLNTRQAFMFRLIRDNNLTHAEAYRVAYCKPNVTPAQAATASYRICSLPHFAEALERIRFDGIAPLMTLNDRLGHLAAIIASPTATRYERIRAAEVYTKIAGDGAPELPPDESGKLNADTPLRVTVDIFLNAPSRVRTVTPLQTRTVTPATTSNGNGHA